MWLSANLSWTRKVYGVWTSRGNTTGIRVEASAAPNYNTTKVGFRGKEIF